ncbi:golgin subfamily A member 6-like protein 22 isoform X1 [Camelus dromedarius]|uniref:golgin subfamily A member 6-like protein 22 isoform X1 n=1 Tax=Camelus dromedarius TaxID=9838 RepID=UPI0031198537
MTEEIREREKTSAEDLDEREVPIFSGMENEPPEQTVKELQQMLENQKIGFMKFVFKIIGDTREREKLLREMNEKIEWLKASVMITDEQEECCMKEGDLLCDTGETSAAEWARREAAERGKEPLEQKVKLLQQKLDKEEIAFEEFRVKMTEEIRECDDLLRKVDQSIKELEASVMITDEQEECCMKKSELLCDAGKTSAEEWTRRVAAEKVMECLEQKYTEFWQKLEDQERVHEGLIAIMTQEIIEREKSSAAEEWARGAVSVCLKREKVTLEQKVKELQRKLHKQERAFKRFRAQVTEEIIERDRLRKKMNKRIENLEALLILIKRREKCCIKKDELCCVAVKTLAAEWARREAAERGKEALEEKIKELQQMLEDQERVSEGFRAQVPEEMKEREKTSAEDLDKKEVEREMELLKQKIKELQQMLEDQERVSEGFRAQIPEEMKEREKTSAEDLDKKEVEREMELLKQKIKELQQMLEDQERVSEGFRPQIPEEMKEREKTSAEEPNKREEAEREEESLEQNVKGLQQKLEDRQTDVNGLKAQVTEGISKREKTSVDLPGTAEWDLSEAAEGEKVDLEQKVRELQQMLEDQERAFEFYRVIITEEIQGIDDLLRKISESTELLEATINNENDRIMSKMLKMTARPR